MVTSSDQNQFPYLERAARVEAARKAIKAAFRKVTWRDNLNDPATAAWHAAIAEFHAALRAAYPPTFWADRKRLQAGDTAVLPAAIEFLEADPLFFRSGYVKADLLRSIKRLPLSPEQVNRLRRVILSIVDRRDGREFRDYCRLARRIDGVNFRGELSRRLEYPDLAVRRRARWVLDALGEK